MTETDISNLKWMIRCNDESGIGFLGPSVRRFGRLPELDHLTKDGLATCYDGSPWQPVKSKYGYWITEAGRLAVTNGDR